MKLSVTKILALLLTLCGCTSKVKSISSRDLSAYERDDGKQYARVGGGNEAEKKPPEVFIRNREIRIEYQEPENTSGSLFSPDDARNYLFITYNTPAQGTYLTVRVVNHNSPPAKKPEKSGASEQPPQTGEAAGQEGGEAAKESLVEDELLKSLPHLEPAATEMATVVDQLRMKVIHRYPNGDLLLSWERLSSGPEDARVLKVQARLPYRQLNPSEDITTKDLTDVVIREDYEGDTFEKKSTDWQDEYTLRISGFDESRSKMAAELESKHQEVLKIRDKVRDRLKSLGSERRQWAKERDGWIKKRDEDQKKVAEAEKSLEEQKSTIEEQKNTIKEQETRIEELSRPEEKPDDQ